MSQNASNIREKVEQLSSDMAFLHRLVHGTDTETVPLGTPPVPTPSLRKMAKDIDARESKKAQEAVTEGLYRLEVQGSTQIAAATAQAQASAQSAERANVYASAAQADAARAGFCADAARDSYEKTYALSGLYDHHLYEIRQDVNDMRTGHALSLASLALAGIRSARARLYETLQVLRLQPGIVAMDAIHHLHEIRQDVDDMRTGHALLLASLALAGIRGVRARLYDTLHVLRLQPGIVAMDAIINRINTAKRGILYG